MSVAQGPQTRTMDVANRSNPCAGSFGAFYSFYIQRPRLARPLARLAWGVDASPLYASLAEIRAVPEDGVVLDLPCGSGLALRGLDPTQRVHYLAVDLDPRMLRRTGKRARKERLSQVDCLRADAARLPLADQVVDLCISHGGLHCVSRPARALGEIGRCLRPGGRLVGTTFVQPGTRRQRFLFARKRRRGGLPTLWTEDHLRDQLRRSGLAEIELQVDAGFVLFRAQRPAGAGEVPR